MDSDMGLVLIRQQAITSTNDDQDLHMTYSDTWCK